MRYSRQELARHIQVGGSSVDEKREQYERRLAQGRRELSERRQGNPAQWNKVDISLSEKQKVMERGDCFEPRSVMDRRRGEERRSEYSRRV